MNYMEDIYRLSYIKRYSNVPKIKEESVAEHGFFVAAILMDLHTKYIFNLGEALIIAVSHDMPEMELNDCPHIIKRKYPEIAAAYEKCEADVVKKLPPAVRWGAMQFDKSDKSIEAKMVHLADAMQCIQFAQAEVRLGNNGYMGIVLSNSLSRVKQLEDDLHEYKRV